MGVIKQYLVLVINTASTTPTAITNLVSNTGVVATDTAGVGTEDMV